MAQPAARAGNPADASANGGPQLQAAPAQEHSMWRQLLRAAAIYFLIQFLLGPKSPFKDYLPQKPTPAPSAAVPSPSLATPLPGSTPGQALPASNNLRSSQTQLFNLIPLWPEGTPLDIHVHLTVTSVPTGPSSYDPLPVSKSLPSTVFKNVPWGRWDWEETWETVIDTPEAVKRNASLWADFWIVRSDDETFKSLGDRIWSAGGDRGVVEKARKGELVHRRKLLTRYQPYRAPRKTKSLLSSSDDTPSATEEVEKDEDASRPTLIVPYYHQNISLALITTNKNAKKPPPPGYIAPPVNWAQLPPPLREHIVIDPLGRRTDDDKFGHHFPILFPNDFWLMKEHMYPINETVSQLPLRIDLHPLSYIKFQLYATMHDAFSQQAEKTGGAGAAEMDELKRVIMEGNPILLATTAVVSVLHSVFEFLAFKNDVSHWRNKKELVGVSVRSIVANVIVQLIILLYLLDNNENTSWMILLGQGVGVLIEAWKITKAVDISFDPNGKTLREKLVIKDKHVLSEDEKKTQEYDALAFKYVTWVTIPVLGAYTIYSLVYETHRGWYSFVISTLTSFVYAFGFVQLIPQLIINYKLKSVAHLPMRSMLYKVTSTFIDDLFAFVIRMPILHRLACFRDDVVFLILLYQYWIYKVDYKRANEYGQVVDEEEIEKSKKEIENVKDKVEEVKEKVESRKDR